MEWHEKEMIIFELIGCYEHYTNPKSILSLNQNNKYWKLYKISSKENCFLELFAVYNASLHGLQHVVLVLIVLL